MVHAVEEVQIAPPHLPAPFLYLGVETGVWASAADITDFAQGSSSGFCNRGRGGREGQRKGGRSVGYLLPWQKVLQAAADSLVL